MVNAETKSRRNGERLRAPEGGYGKRNDHLSHNNREIRRDFANIKLAANENDWNICV